MNMFEEAKAIESMLAARDITQATLAHILGVSQPYIANKLRLLHFPEDIRKMIISSGLTERHARTLLRLPEDKMAAAIEKIKARKMNVREAEITVDLMLEEALVRSPVPEGDAERICRFEKTLALSISNLKEQGIGARSSSERYGDKLYISICIG